VIIGPIDIPKDFRAFGRALANPCYHLPMPKTVTLRDVAKAVEVSKSTVANAFNRPERVRPELLARIETAARELGYAGPDPRGRMLSSGKVNAIGLVPFGRFGIAQFFKNPYQRDFLAGVAQACEERGVGLSLVSGRDDQEAWGIKNALVDGFIFTGVDQVELLEAGRRRRLPFVVMDLSGSPHISSVNTKNRDGAKQATRHLLALGHRRFVIASTLYSFRAPVFHPPAESARRLVDAGPPLLEKLAGVADALAEAELSINDVPIVEACGTPEEEKAFGNGAAMLLDKAPEATAIIGLADSIALSILRQAKKRGLNVPRDLSLVGFDDVPEAAQSEPPLTTIHVSAAENGRAAVHLLLAGGPPRQVFTSVNLVIRGSTAPPRKRARRR
jgi:DNA-binding LacI/PurR family transcriptional regulator